MVGGAFWLSRMKCIPPFLGSELDERLQGMADSGDLVPGAIERSLEGW